MTLISFMSKFSLNTQLTDKILTSPHNRVYSPGSLYLKDPHFFQTSGGISEALPALVDPDYHKRRRRMINSLFSAKSIDQLAPIVLGVIKRALNKAAESHEKKKPLDIQRLYTGVTVRELGICGVRFSLQLGLTSFTSMLDRYNHESALR